jgi:hypothetical protein
MTALATSSTSARVGIGLVDHRLQHLGGGDHHPVARQRLADDLLLQAGQLGVADLHAQVAARDHHHVAGVDDLGQVLDRLGALDLGHQRARRCRRRAPARALRPCRRRCGRTTPR